MRAALQALLNYNMRTGDHETVYALASAATGARCPYPPGRPAALEASIAAEHTGRIFGDPSPPPGYSSE